MNENKQHSIMEEELPSADLAQAGMILILFFISTAFLLRLFPFHISQAEAHTEHLTRQLIEYAGEDTPVTLAMPLPPPAAPFKPPVGKVAAKMKEAENIPTYQFSSFKGKKGEHVYFPIIQRVAESHGIEPALIKAMIMAESSFNPKAVSNKGAAGLMQLMPKTAKSLGVVNRFDPEQNIRGGVKYIKHLIEKCNGNLKHAIAAYNAGFGHVIKYKGVPPFKATRYYVQKVFHYYDYYRQKDRNDVRKLKNAENDSFEKNHSDLKKAQTPA
jgi:hypothetical protein